VLDSCVRNMNRWMILLESHLVDEKLRASQFWICLFQGQQSAIGNFNEEI
jgi:hypothetical protein